MPLKKRGCGRIGQIEGDVAEEGRNWDKEEIPDSG